MKISTSSIVDRSKHTTYIIVNTLFIILLVVPYPKTSEEVLADLLRDLETINLAKKVKVGSLLYERVSSSVYRGVLRDRIDTSGSERIKRVIIKRFRVPIIDQDQIIKVCLFSSSKPVLMRKSTVAYITRVKSLGEFGTPKYSSTSWFHYAGQWRLGNVSVTGI